MKKKRESFNLDLEHLWSISVQVLLSRLLRLKCCTSARRFDLCDMKEATGSLVSYILYIATEDRPQLSTSHQV